MTKQTTSIGSNLFEKLQLDLEQKKKLEKLEKDQAELEAENEKELTEYESSVQKMVSGQEKVDVTKLSKLEQGLERGKKYKTEICDLAESLTREFQDLGQFLGDMSQYQGFWEKTAAQFGFTRQADKWRLDRVKTVDVKQNLQTVLDYGHHMVGRLYSAILENMESYARLDALVISTSVKLEENQPLYEQWRSTREKLERDKKTVADKLDLATEGERPALQIEFNGLQKEFDKAQINENDYFNKVSASKQALPLQQKHRQGYKDLVDSLTQFRTALEENIQNMTEVFLNVPIAIQTALKMKAASQYDKSFKYAADVSTDALLKSVEGVLDEVATRSERPLIEQDKLNAYQQLQREMRAKFDERITALKTQYAKPGA